MNLEEQREKAKKETIESEGTNLLVYNVPNELYTKCISLAKLYYDNELWRVLEAGVERILTDKDKWKEEINNHFKEHEIRFATIEAKLAFLMESSNKDEEKEATTFGGGG